MKYKTIVVILSLLLASTVAIGGARYLSADRSGGEKVKIVASFYPVYIAARNILDGMEDVQLTCLADSNVGCVHDFQLRPQDMMVLEGADLLLINGGGMEPFVEQIAKQNPNLPTIDISRGISLLPAAESSLHFGEDDHAHAESAYNAHVWLSPSRYLQQLDNLCGALSAQLPQYTEVLRRNTASYKQKVVALQEEFQQAASLLQTRDVILFHDSFAYFADDIGLHVAGVIPMEADTALSAGDIARIIDTVNRAGVRVLLAEEQYSTELADAIANETNAVVYTLDTGVSGPMTNDAYLDAMRKDLGVLRRALT